MKSDPPDYKRACFLVTLSFLQMATRFFAGALLLALGLAVILLPAGGEARLPEWLLFIGRFHPLILHLPIGLLVLLPMLNLLARFCPPGTLRPAVVTVLWLCAGSAFSAVICGLLLAQEGGYSGPTLGWHRLLALLLTVFAVLLMVCESESENLSLSQLRLARCARLTYSVLLPLVLVCLGVAAHLGANLTHGSAFLTEHLPSQLKARLSGDAAPVSHSAAPKESAYATLVAPILDARCTSCHGAEKSKGGLRLQTLNGILAGGESQRDEHKFTVIPGQADKSLLIRSVCLPLDDDAHMPPAGKPQLTSAEIATLRWWIDSGADAQTPASKAPDARLARKVMPAIPRS